MVSQAEISTFIEDRDGVTISHAKIAADQIDFETGSMEVKNNGVRIFYLNGNGDLELRGNIYASNIYGDIKIGSQSNKMYIRPNASNGVNLVGIDGNNNEVISLGFTSGDIPVDNSIQTVTHARLDLSYYASSIKKAGISIKPTSIELTENRGGKTTLTFNSLTTNSIYADCFYIKTSSGSGSTFFAQGYNGTFTAGSKTVTVKYGIITNVA